MALIRITDNDLAGKGNVGRPDIPGVSTSEMQRILDELPREVIVPAFNKLAEQVETELADRYTKKEADAALNEKAFEIGSGDMMKKVYDPDDLGTDATVQVYSCTKSGSVYALTGSGAVGRCKIPQTWQSGNTFTVNGKTVPAYCGADAVDGDTIAAGRWVTFVFDGARLDFSGGGGLTKNKLAQATAKPADVPQGLTYYGGSSKALQTGTMPVRGNWSAEIAPGGSVTVPAGRHNGGGTVTARPLKTVTLKISDWPQGSDMEWYYTLANGTLVGVAGLDESSGDGSTNFIGHIRISGNTIYVKNAQGGIMMRNITLLYY